MGRDACLVNFLRPVELFRMDDDGFSGAYAPPVHKDKEIPLFCGLSIDASCVGL